MTDDYPLSNLKFVIKGGVDEVFGMPIPKDLLTDAFKIQMEDVEYNLKRGIQMSLESLQASIGEVVIHEFDSGFIQKLPEDTVANMGQSNIKNDTEILNVEEECGEEVSNMVALEERTVELGEGQAGSDPGKDTGSRTSTECEHYGMEDPGWIRNWTKSLWLRSGPVPETMQEDSLESTKLIRDSFINEESGIMFTLVINSLMDNQGEEREKANVKLMLNPLSLFLPSSFFISSSTVTPIINLSHLPTCISADYEQKNKLQDKITQAFASRVYKLEHHDLYFKINKQVNEVVNEVFIMPLQAPLRDLQRFVVNFKWKEILHDRSLTKFVDDDSDDQILLHLLQRTLTEARRKSMIMMFLLQNNLEFKSPWLGRPLTPRKLPLKKACSVYIQAESGLLSRLRAQRINYELFKFNPGMENRIWTEDDKWRSQEFIKLIERRLKIRRIFRSLESFVSERLRDVDYKSSSFQNDSSFDS
ncbi:hypothetical protein Tco_0295477 [Tanacetum coccineum]